MRLEYYSSIFVINHPSQYSNDQFDRLFQVRELQPLLELPVTLAVEWRDDQHG